MFNNLKITSIAVLLLSVVFIRTAHAYLDPGTGSYIVQIIIATMIGSSFAIKLVWKNISTFLKGMFSKKRDEYSEEKDESLKQSDE